MTWVACDFNNDAMTCQRCGFVAKTRDTRKACIPVPKPGLGDHVARWLSWFGITKARVSAIVGSDCECGARQEQANDIGRRWFGIG